MADWLWSDGITGWNQVKMSWFIGWPYIIRTARG